jgi:ureidoglycolate lyase
MHVPIHGPKMPVTIESPGVPIHLAAQVLQQDAFSEFGTVIENPAPSLVPAQQMEYFPPSAVQANQGSALKYVDVACMKNLYGSAPSGQPSKAVMNMFVCAPRPLLQSKLSRTEGLFPVKILERHPFTTQTFIPLGISQSDSYETHYLVIVAPSLPPSRADEIFPVPVARGSPGRGLPDLERIKAFVANGSQAVSYGAGTWHAPMVVVGKKPIDFVVVQFANGIQIEDCQEVDWKQDGEAGIQVGVRRIVRNGGSWKL